MKQNRVAHVASIVFLVLAIGLTPAALAAKGGGGKGRNCTQNAPGVSVDNTWAWSAPGSWGLPGQQLKYAIQVRNYDLGCGSSSFVISASAPTGFSVSVPTSTITLGSSSSAYLSAYVTSPAAIVEGNYPLTFTVRRVGTTDPTGTFTSYYKVYSSDTAAPTLYWPNPANGQTITDRTYNVIVSSSDDHAVKEIDIYIDNSYVSTTTCDGIAYTCQGYYEWSVGARGQHTATFKSSDWLGNVGVMTTTFNVG
jgi:hypothetical protein